ncbi:hypothetical protein [Catenuloplanes atrovinosus]|uniref:Uncharacterized protein n=1 Tax=Catenuloplanes atrovinosus TaxID=137266 RepID=A0AAE3YPD5_9ACTN|nr:hypothetical protein [Catenuloplanes atrovinosus]MDR7277220.1 hypothetical protein [Catenuloplanes atrovinosus]
MDSDPGPVGFGWAVEDVGLVGLVGGVDLEEGVFGEADVVFGDRGGAVHGEGRAVVVARIAMIIYAAAVEVVE